MSSPRRKPRAASARRRRARGSAARSASSPRRAGGARLGDERRPDLAAELGADRDRLQVRARGREPPGGGDVWLTSCGVGRPRRSASGADRGTCSRASSARATPRRGDDLVVRADRAQHLAVGRVSGLALAARRQFELLEEDPAELHRRADDELLARELDARTSSSSMRSESRAVISPCGTCRCGRRRPPSRRARRRAGSRPRRRASRARAREPSPKSGASRRAASACRTRRRSRPQSPAPARARARSRPRGRRAGTRRGRGR